MRVIILALGALLLLSGRSLAAEGLVLRGEMAGFEVHETPREAIAASFDDRAGGRLALSAYEGKVVLLNVWATWCAPCIAEMPYLDQLAAQKAGDDFVVLAVSLDFKPQMIGPFLERVSLPNLVIVHDDAKHMQRDYGVRPLPTTLLIDRQGREVARYMGDAHWDQADALALVESAIANLP